MEDSRGIYHTFSIMRIGASSIALQMSRCRGGASVLVDGESLATLAVSANIEGSDEVE